MFITLLNIKKVLTAASASFFPNFQTYLPLFTFCQTQLITSVLLLKVSNVSCAFTGTSALPGSCCDHTERILQCHFKGRGSRSLVEESDLQGDLQTGWRCTGRVQRSALGVRNEQRRVCHSGLCHSVDLLD